MTPHSQLKSFLDFVDRNQSYFRTRFKLKPNELRLLWKLVTVSPETANSTTSSSFCYASNQTLARMTGLSVSQVTRVLNSLDSKCFLRMVRKGNGKRFRNQRCIRSVPVGSHIDLEPLMNLALNKREFEDEIWHQKVLTDDLKNAIHEKKHLLQDILSQEELSAALKAEFLSLQKKRVPGMKTPAKLEAYLKELTELEARVGLVLDFAQTCKTRCNVTRNALHKEPPKNEYIFVLGISVREAMDMTIDGIPMKDLALVYPEAFGYFERFSSVDVALNRALKSLALQLSDLGPLLDGEPDYDATFLLIIYLINQNPKHPRKYVEALSKKRALGHFDIRATVHQAVPRKIHALKNNQRNQKGDARHAEGR